MFELHAADRGFISKDIKSDGDVALLYRSPITITVNKFTEDSAKEFKTQGRKSFLLKSTAMVAKYIRLSK